MPVYESFAKVNKSPLSPIETYHVPTSNQLREEIFGVLVRCNQLNSSVSSVRQLPIKDDER